MATGNHSEIGQLIEECKSAIKERQLVESRLANFGSDMERLATSLKDKHFDEAARVVDGMKARNEAPLDSAYVFKLVCQWSRLSTEIDRNRSELRSRHGISCVSFDL